MLFSVMLLSLKCHIITDKMHIVHTPVYQLNGVGMLNQVQIFKASVFNSELNSNFTNSKLDSPSTARA